MSERTIAEFVNIAQPILDEYKKGMAEVIKQFDKSIDENIPNMSKYEQIIFATMFDKVERELKKEM